VDRQKIGVLAVLFILSGSSQAFAATELERVEIINPRLENSFGVEISEKVNVNQQVQISTDIKNNQEKTQKFVYIVQVKNHYDVIVSVGWISGSLSPGQTFNPSLSWTPTTPDTYTAEIYVWAGLLEHDALAEPKMLTMTSS
jgi:hypothetical protein